MAIKLGKTYRPEDFDQRINIWVGDRYRISIAAFVWLDEGKHYLSYLGSPTNSFLSTEVTVEISGDEYSKAVSNELNWSYFKEKYVR